MSPSHLVYSYAKTIAFRLINCQHNFAAFLNKILGNRASLGVVRAGGRVSWIIMRARLSQVPQPLL